jgi:hypothetical protein
MQHLLIWFHVSGLVVHIKKIKRMLFHTWQDISCLNPSIIFNGTDMKYKYETNFWVDV